jgi:hypothetical protein
MSETSTLIGYTGQTIGREELALVPTPTGDRNAPPDPPSTRCRRMSPVQSIIAAFRLVFFLKEWRGHT